MMLRGRAKSLLEQEQSRARRERACSVLRDLVARRLNSRDADERRCLPPHVVLELGAEGVLAMQVADGDGGIDLSWADTAQVLQLAGSLDLTLAAFVLTNNFPGVRPIMNFAAHELRAHWLPLLARGRVLAGYAQTEAMAGSDFQAMAARAERVEPGRWRLSGEKVWVGNAAWAGVLNVFVRMGDAEAGLSAFAVDARRPGFSIGAEHATLGLRGMVQNRVKLDGVLVSTADLLGDVGGGLEVAYDSMGATRLGIAAFCMGGLRRCLQLLLRFVERRNVATGPLLEHPVTLMTVARMIARCQLLDALLRVVVEELDRGSAVSGEVLAILKTAGGEFLCASADELVQSLGGRGYDEANLAARMLRDARVTRIFEGTSQVLLSYVGARAWVDAPPLRELVIGTLQAPDRMADLDDALAALRRRPLCRGASAPAIASHWRYALVGELTYWTVLVAAGERAEKRGSPEIGPSAVAWARGQLADAAARVRAQSVDEGLIDAAARVVERGRRCIEQIGDVEQSLPGFELSPDILLRKVTLEERD